MKNKRLATLLMSVVFSTTLFFGQTVVSTHGRLRVSGGHVVNKNNEWISLSGNSLFWSSNGWGGEKFYNASVVSYLKSDWKSSIVRIAMGVNDGGGYTDDPAGNTAKVKTVVDACIANGLYVIIDFHSHVAQNYSSQAVAFFQDMARTYGTYDNVMYEVFNEPLQVSWSGVVKPYAQTVINAIRAIDPDNLIIVGTPTWSQDVDAAANDQISATNIAYTLHFYAGSHFQSLRDKANYAMSKGAAVFITEWGTCDASGNGGYNESSSNDWLNWAKTNGVSICNWSVNDKAETASILNPGASSTGGWSTSNYTTSGNYVRNQMRSWPTAIGTTPPTPTCTTVSLPGTIEAESFCDKSGVQTETCSEGGQNVGYIDAGDWMSYSVSVATAGTYKVTFRVASLSGGGNIQLDKDAGTTILGTVAVSSTSGWQNWSNVTLNVTLPAGSYYIGINAKAGGFNINNFKVESTSVTNPTFYQKIEAESYNQKSTAPKSETCSEGGLDMGYIGNGDWFTYPVTIPSTASYKVTYRVASAGTGGQIRLDKDAGATVLGTVTASGTGGWQTWTSVSHTVTLPAGTYNLGINALTGGLNINWIEISSIASVQSAKIETMVKSVELGLRVYPNPCKNALNVTVNNDLDFTSEVYDIAGKLQLKCKLSQGTNELNTSNLSNGIYFMKISNNEKIVIEKFIKN